MNDQEKTKEQLMEDVTELRQNLDALVDYLPEAFFIVDAPDVTIRLASRDSQQMLGVSLRQLKGLHDLEHFEYYRVFRPDGTAVEVEQLPLSRALSTGEIIRNEEWLMQSKDGRRFPTLCQAGPVRGQDGTICGAVICWHDISDRKRAEEALKKARDELELRVEERTAELAAINAQLHREIEERKRIEAALRQSEELYRTLIEVSPDAVIMVDLEQNVAFTSQRAAELFGYDSAKDLCGARVDALTVEEDRQRLASNILLLFQQQMRQQTEYTGVRKDGSRFTAEVSSALLRDDAGEPKAFMAVIRDITERRRAREALEREYRTLKHLLQSSDHERQLIAYEIHDGLAQQLAGAIMQFETYFYQKDARPEKAAKAYDAGMTMLRQGHSESRRLISGVRPPILDESGVVAAIAHLVSDWNSPKGPKIEYFSAVTFDRLVPIVENAIYRIAQEGLTNACQHSQSENVRVSLIQREDRVRIDIRDWGAGFDVNAVQENRFGLEGIRQRVRLLGGKCSIRSRPGKGTRVVVELPVVKKEES
jgi:PAS domain S-box-containing protein